jgi:hypothetical protein
MPSSLCVSLLMLIGGVITISGIPSFKRYPRVSKSLIFTGFILMFISVLLAWFSGAK